MAGEIRGRDALIAWLSWLGVQVALHDYPGGRRFTFADPSGNVLGVYEPSE
jgi:hypothetical protein